VEFNGWMRLWVGLSVLWLVLVVAMAVAEYMRAPEAVRSSLEAKAHSATQYATDLRGLEALTPEQNAELARLQSEAAEAMQKAQAMSRGESVPELRAWRLKSFGLHIVVWLGLPLVLSVTGLVVARVVLGLGQESRLRSIAESQPGRGSSLKADVGRIPLIIGYFFARLEGAGKSVREHF